MKILQLGKFYPIQGGVEKVMYDLMLGLSSNENIDCDMLCVGSSIQPWSTIINPHAALYCARLDKKLFSTMLSIDLIKKLKSMAKEYDIIHIHHPDPMAALALRLSGFKGKVVLHWHSDIVKQKVLLKLYKPLQNWIINRADVIIGTTPKYLAESPHLKKCKTTKIAVPIGIDPILYDKEKVEEIKYLYSSKHIIFTLGRLVEYKGFNFLIEAARYLPDNFVILIGGSGPLKNELQKRIESHKLESKVKLLGRLSDDALPAYYGACDVFVLPSIWKTEAFGIVQIEAMACGKPVVATTIPESGVDWVNKDGYSGINVPPQNPQALAKAISDIIKNKDIYKRFSSNALNLYKERYTTQKMVENCINIYRELI